MFEDVGDQRIRSAVAAVLSEADLNVVIASAIDFHRGRTKRAE